jgi:hypothetical protein
MALSSGEQCSDILILEPTTSIWQYYAYDKSNNKFRETGQAFQTFITTLEKAQMEYDLGSENIIKDHGKTVKGKFAINKRAYSKVVIPPMMENLDLSTFKLLKKFAGKGGTILTFSTPAALDGKPNADMEKFFTEDKNVLHLTELNDEVIEKHFSAPHISFTKQGGNLFHHSRIMPDGQALFLVNSSLEEATKGTVTVAGADAVELNTLTGEIRDYPETADKDNIRIDFNIPPAGSLLLYVFNKPQHEFALPVAARTYTAVEASSPITITPQASNVLTIDFCDLQLGTETFRDLHVFDAADKTFKAHGFTAGNPWNTSVQFKDRILSRDTFTTGGFTAIYKFTVADEFDRSDMQAVVERPQLYKVSLNGKEIQPEAGKWWLDRETGVFSIGREVKKGENDLVIELPVMKIMAEIEMVYILGNFSVKSAAKGWTLHAPVGLTTGSWKAQNRPFYPGAVSYGKQWNITDPSGSYRVRIDNWSGTVAEVSVNGVSAGIVTTEPYTADVSGLLKSDSNDVQVKIIGSNKNLLGPFHNNPRPGMTSPGSFRNVKSYPSGKDYQQPDYGLMGDFLLEKGE